MTRRRVALVTAGALVVVAAACVVAFHDFRARTVARGSVDGVTWSVRAWRSMSEQCLAVLEDGQVTGAACGFDVHEPDATGSVAGHTVLVGPAPSDAVTVVVEGVGVPDVRAATRKLAWLPPRRVFVVVLPKGYEEKGFHFEDRDGDRVGP